MTGIDKLQAFQSIAQPRWFALSVKPRHEKSVVQALRLQQLEEFLPLYREQHAWSDRTRWVEVPLFAGYVFCRFSFADRLAVLNTRGVIRILGAGNIFAPVSEEQISELRAVVASGLPARPCSYLAPGEMVRVERGPLAGVRGMVLRHKGVTSVVVSVEILQRSVVVEVDSDAVRPDIFRRQLAHAGS
jgi:transcription antitermination factor NusG